MKKWLQFFESDVLNLSSMDCIVEEFNVIRLYNIKLNRGFVLQS